MTEVLRLDCKMCGLKLHDQMTTKVWFVLEDDDESVMPTLWRTEKDARVYAKRTYPNELPEEWELRICWEQILSYDDQYCADELEETND